MTSSASRRATAHDAFLAARRTFIAGRRVEMQPLAAALGVNRATLFRWVGGRDALLADINWSLAEPVLRRARAQCAVGDDRIAAVMGEFSAVVIAADFFTVFLRREPERALRILTTRAGTFQARLIGSVADMIQEEVDAGRLDPPLPVNDMAYLVVRIAESFIYTDTITGETADSSKVAPAISTLLR